MFYVEGPDNSEFGSVSECMWWATTALTTVGYGDLYPKSGLGRFVASVTAFLGVGLFALPAGIISNGFQTRAQVQLGGSKRIEEALAAEKEARKAEERMVEALAIRLETRLDRTLD